MGNRKQSRSSRLEEYREKRSAQRTPEPFGAPSVSRPRLFCVQKHAARRLHYDFRLEWSGTLLSWAVPKGPSLDPAVKRLAVQVEDHPVDYADFEGTIPQGNYGAGAVIVWDKGLWIPQDDPDEIARTGKLHFELRGYKLRGQWLLIRTKDKEWLLRKKPDEWASREEPPPPEESVLSGLTIEELRDGHNRSQATRAALRTLRAPRKLVDPLRMDLMLAETADAPFSSPEWLFELKYDGYRVIAARRKDGEPLLRSRNGHDITHVFPDVARALRSLPYADLVLDAELVVLDEGGHPDFQKLQRRARSRRPTDVERATVELPASLFVFDLLGFEGLDLRSLPLLERKKLLEPLLPRAGPVRFADHVQERGVEMFEKVREMGLEGAIAKKVDAPYRGGRTTSWLKIVVERTGDFVVCGYTAPKGSRTGFGALHLGIHENGELVYAGRVGTGFVDAELGEYRAALDEMLVADPPCRGEVPRSKEHRWVRPEWVAEVRYKQVTTDGWLQAPVFSRLREDKRPEECVRETASDDTAEPESTIAAEEPQGDERIIRLTNPDKVFWPEEGYTKGDLVEYYRTVSAWLLPYLRNRPLVLTRYPDGIEGKSFYQKNAPEFVPKWIRRVAVWSGSSEREIEYLVCNDEESLLYIVNMGSIPLHIWPSRADTIQSPDWCILDLDPKGAPFAHVVELAKAIRALCEEIGLETFVKTTGSTGLHILLPLGGQCTFEQSRMLGQLISRIIEADHPDISTTARNMVARKGRVYLDYLQNRHGQLLVAPYSVRPLPGAPVSAPLEWSEVNARLTPQKFTIRNLPARLKRKKKDPLRALLDARPDLVSALARLAARLEDAP
ncbi:MAG: DNA ligase D [Candidatus Krumholzibacteriia bacterium]